MKNKYLSMILAGAVALSLAGCAGPNKSTATQKTAEKTAAKSEAAKATKAEAKESKKEAAKESKKDDKAQAKPGESGFNEIPIGEAKEAGPFNVEAVYFQGVDMIPENKQPSAEESDMHIEADIHMKPEAAKAFGFGDGEDIWPAYLNVNYKVMSQDGKKEIISGSLMPMNADDGPHYGINVKKGVIPVGKYKLVIEIKASEDYLLHVDSETGVPAARDNGKAAANKYYEKQKVTFDWNYDASQLASK
ncbi:iron transporter [Amygdalobacter indicium]|jgi:hypothetical protein|uniref:Iron transporter n=1 Tax=Amygdalobacter indicium TaxID=3029272 RepID=A0ABY8C5X8_9FIRM|nr:iron transporter [Amygdalobacter indicium]WEG34505.1 iron transporter [Amygdalobacter indicium]WEG36088.1 iron transporter [Amygdalobacter indicium]